MPTPTQKRSVTVTGSQPQKAPSSILQKTVPPRSQSGRAGPSSVTAPPTRPTLARANTIGPQFPDFLTPEQEGTLKQSKGMDGRLRPFRFGMVQGWKAGKKRMIAALEKRR
jgi:hypothetical protein